LPQSVRFPAHPVTLQVEAVAHCTPQSAEPEHATVQSPWQVTSHDELPPHELLEAGPSTMLQSDVEGQTALQLALHCMPQLELLAQLRLQPGVHVATQGDPVQVQTRLLTSQVQGPVQVALLVMSLTTGSVEESPPVASGVGGVS
jgi:hypothetical protein